MRVTLRNELAIVIRKFVAQVTVGMTARYLLIGGLTFAVYFLLLGLLFDALRTPYPVAVVIAYSLAVAFHFFANRRFTFQVEALSADGQVAKYVVVLAVNYCLQVAVIYCLYELATFNFYLAALVGIAITLFVGFFLLRFWVFAPSTVASRYGHRV